MLPKKTYFIVKTDHIKSGIWNFIFSNPFILLLFFLFFKVTEKIGKWSSWQAERDEVGEHDEVPSLFRSSMWPLKCTLNRYCIISHINDAWEYHFHNVKGEAKVTSHFSLEFSPHLKKKVSHMYVCIYREIFKVFNFSCFLSVSQNVLTANYCCWYIT